MVVYSLTAHCCASLGDFWPENTYLPRFSNIVQSWVTCGLVTIGSRNFAPRKISSQPVAAVRIGSFSVRYLSVRSDLYGGGTASLMSTSRITSGRDHQLINSADNSF